MKTAKHAPYSTWEAEYSDPGPHPKTSQRPKVSQRIIPDPRLRTSCAPRFSAPTSYFLFAKRESTKEKRLLSPPLLSIHIPPKPPNHSRQQCRQKRTPRKHHACFLGHLLSPEPVFPYTYTTRPRLPPGPARCAAPQFILPNPSPSIPLYTTPFASMHQEWQPSKAIEWGLRHGPAPGRLDAQAKGDPVANGTPHYTPVDDICQRS